MDYGRSSFRCTSNFEHKDSITSSSRQLKHTTQSTVNVHMKLLTRIAISGSSSFQLFSSSLSLEKSQHMFLMWPTELQSAVLEPRVMEEKPQNKQADYINIILTIWLLQQGKLSPSHSVQCFMTYICISSTPSFKTFFFNLHQITVLIWILPARYPDCLNATY